MFKKGAFEAADTIRPIAMRYNPRYGDAFWAQDGWTEHIMALVTWFFLRSIGYGLSST